tara:strand:- start:426 stop:599 length:174 start_codon:yes stop_codon:yes gene_type:complete
MDKDYQTKIELIVRTHDDRGLYKRFYQFGHEILDDETLERIFASIEQAVLREESDDV